MAGWRAETIQLANVFEGERRDAAPGRFYLTAPKVRPRTSCFCENQPRIMIGAMANIEAADRVAKKAPWCVE
jgi:hypothetical protein